MPNDEISTLALRVSSGDAIKNLRAVARESEALGGITDELKGKVLSAVSAYASWRFGKVLLDDAAEGQEAAGKFEAVLGRIEAQGKKVADELVANFNFSRTAALGAVSGMVDTFKKSGIASEQALSWASDLNKLAADLEAFTNAEGGVASVSEKLTKALLGNTESVRSLGIVISAESIQAEMARMKNEGLISSFNNAAKKQAIYNLMMNQTVAAHGQVAREADNYSNRLRYLNARLTDLRSSLGEALIPAMTIVVDKSASLVAQINELSPGTKNLIVGFGAMTGALLTFGPTVLKVVAGVKACTAAKTLETLATQKETAATTAETEALVAQSPAAIKNYGHTEAITYAKTSEAFARYRNAQAIEAENLALSKGGVGRTAGKLVSAASRGGQVANLAGTGSLASGATKPLQQFGKEIGNIAMTAGTKTPLLRTFGVGLTRVGSLFSTAAAGVGVAVIALEGFKHAPHMLEVALDKVPEIFSTVANKTIEGFKTAVPAVMNWGKNLVIDGFLGAAQYWKRLLGMETEASREYKLNKQIEENNKKRAELQEQEAKQRAAENAVLTAQNAAAQSKVNAQLEINNSKESESVKLARAIELRNQKEYELSHVKNPNDENDLGGKEQQLTALQSQLASGNLTNEQREEITEKAKQLSEEISTLRDEWKEATLDIEKLSESAANAAKAFDDNQKAYERQKLSASEGIADAEAQNLLESANSHQARQHALQNQRNRALERLETSQNAQGEADALNEQAKTVQGQLTNDKVAQALATLGTLAKTGDLSYDAGLKYANAKVMLRDAGYGDIVDKNEGFGQGSALQFLEAMTQRQREQQKELESLLKGRDEKQELANEAGSRLSAYNQAQRSVENESKAFAESLENERRQNEENERRRARANRSFQNSINETYFNRQLQASDQFYGKDALGAAQSRYNLIGQRGASEWADSISALKEQQDRLNELNTSLDELNKKFKEGTLTDDETKERERLMAQRTSLEEELNSDYQAAVQKRLQTEDTLLDLEKTMREEYLKNVKNYVTEEGNALRERLQAEAEYEKKRMEELSKVQEEARQAVSGQRGIAAGSSEAFNIASKIYDRGRENLPTEKKIEDSTKKIEEYVKTMQENMMAYFTEQSSGMTLAFGY